MVLDSPNLLSILFKLLGVMHPHPSISYIENASFKSLALSSSLPSSNNLTNSSNPSNPSGPEPILKMASWASSKDKSSPMEAMHRCSSAGDSFPSLFSSKQSNTRPLFPIPSDIAQLHSFLNQSEEFLRAESTRLASCALQLDLVKHSLGYLYVLGMICIGQKQFRKALELLQNVVTAPMSTLNAIAVEAYKKYILVSLIHLGQFSTSFPKYTSSVAQRNLKNYSQAYLELANSYSTGRISELETCVQTHKDKYQSDNNLGIVQQVVSSMYKRNIQRLTQTYLTLSLQDIAITVQLSSPKEAEMHVLQMIEDGEIYANINQKDGMVRFLEDPEQYKTCEMIEHIDSSIQRIMMLSKKLTDMDERMSYDPSYLAKVGKEKQRFDFDDFEGVAPKFNL
nr:COP9 signalosome complex subunit 3 [Ipomoea batatas]